MYVTKQQVQQALRKMQGFDKDLTALFGNYGMDFEGNTGRRNVLLSQAQEHFLAEEIRKQFPSTRSDGRTGEPDISIPEIDKTLECKLTTPSANGSLRLQSDKEAFTDGAKDFIYFVADDKMENFAVLHFVGLQRDDFSDCKESARGRVKMRKAKTYDRCAVLHGTYEPRSQKMIETIDAQLVRSRPGTKSHANLLRRKKHWEDSSESFTLKLLPL